MFVTDEKSAFSRYLARLENVLVAFSGLSIALIMLVVVADVTMRYVAHSPLGWSYSLIGTYLMVCVFFFALSDTLHHHNHIVIDVFAHRIPRRFTHLSLTVGYVVSALIMALIAWQGWHRFQVAYAANNVISTTVPWPTWPAYMMVVIGSALMAVRCGLRALGHAASLVTGRALAEMPPPPETSPIEEESGI